MYKYVDLRAGNLLLISYGFNFTTQPLPHPEYSHEVSTWS